MAKFCLIYFFVYLPRKKDQLQDKCENLDIGGFIVPAWDFVNDKNIVILATTRSKVIYPRPVTTFQYKQLQSVAAAQMEPTRCSLQQERWYKSAQPCLWQKHLLRNVIICRGFFVLERRSKSCLVRLWVKINMFGNERICHLGRDRNLCL